MAAVPAAIYENLQSRKQALETGIRRGRNRLEKLQATRIEMIVIQSVERMIKLNGVLPFNKVLNYAILSAFAFWADGIACAKEEQWEYAAPQSDSTVKTVAFSLDGAHMPMTEAACKVPVRQHLCGSGMRWKEKGAGVVLSLRALSESTGRWAQFWDKINRFGVLTC